MKALWLNILRVLSKYNETIVEDSVKVVEGDHYYGTMVELADTADLKSAGETREVSSTSSATSNKSTNLHAVLLG